jgi:hypothetical protein
MKRLLFPLLAVVLASCESTGPTTTVTKTTEITPLTTEAMYEPDVVAAFLQLHPGTDNASTDLFMKGIDAYRNKKDAAAAIPLFVQSILKHPTAKAYFELGNASMDVKNYRTAIAAFRTGEQLGFEPLSKLLYNTACAYAQLYKQENSWNVAMNSDAEAPVHSGSGASLRDSALHYLEYSIEAGYSDAAHINKDPDLATLRQGKEVFTTTYTKALTGSSDPETVQWQAFKRDFPQATLPLNLNNQTAKLVNQEQYISYEYERFVPEMAGERFSREVGKEFHYLARINETPRYTALIYVVKNVIMGDNAPYGYVLASFDGRGKLIDKMVAGGQVELDELLKVASIQPNLHFEVKEYKQVWEKDPADQGYFDNKVVSTALKGTHYYHIAEDGHFKEDNSLLGMR